MSFSSKDIFFLAAAQEVHAYLHRNVVKPMGFYATFYGLTSGGNECMGCIRLMMPRENPFWYYFLLVLLLKPPSPLSSFDVDAAGRKHGLCLLSEQHDALVTPSGGYTDCVHVTFFFQNPQTSHVLLSRRPMCLHTFLVISGLMKLILFNTEFPIFWTTNRLLLVGIIIQA